MEEILDVTEIEEISEKLKNINDILSECYMIGILNEEMEEPIKTLNNSDTISIDIKNLNIDLDYEQMIDLEFREFNGIKIVDEYKLLDMDNRDVWASNYNYLELIDRMNFWKGYLKDALICFHPIIKYDKSFKKLHKNIKILNITKNNENYIDTDYILIPSSNLSNSQFESEILDNGLLILEGYNHYCDKPEVIVCGEYLYVGFFDWKNSDVHNLGVEHRGKNNDIEKIDIKHIKIDKIKGTNIYYISNEVVNDIINDSKYKEYKININSNVNIGYMGDKVKLDKIEEKEMIIENSESSFLKNLKNNLLKDNFVYKYEDLINLHICIKTNIITILSGMSGIGKSKIATYYANSLGCHEENGELLFVPISPSYLEPEDILGYLNGMTGLYIPSETGLIDFFRSANEKKDRIHILIFDEMNLSQVEYWFAPFISLLEKDENDRYLNLYSENSNCINNHLYPNTIKIPNNIRIIGTVNMDETTKNFSNRLLDRSNLIKLKKVSFLDYKEEISKEIVGVSEKDFEYKIFNKWISKGDWIDAYTYEELKFFDELNSVLSENNSDRGISFRIMGKIGEYLSNIPKDIYGKNLIDRRLALDLQINQRIITKIKGSELEIGELIGSAVSIDDFSSKLMKIFCSENANLISSFEYTREEIIRKAKELGVFGYVN